MNQNILFATCASIVMCGCNQGDMLSAPGCKPYVVETERCKDSGQAVTVNIDNMTVDNGFVCASKSSVLIFNIENALVEDGSVAIVPKRAVDTWLVGTNSGNRQMIRVKIPRWVKTDLPYYEYSIITDAGDCLDPRVRVR